MNEVWIAVISALGGGTVIKLIEFFLIPKTTQVDYAAKLREELRQDIREYKNEVMLLRSEVNYWRRMYFVLIELLLKNRIDIPDELLNPNPPPIATPKN